MENDETGCYENYVKGRLSKFGDKASNDASRAFDSAMKEIKQRYVRDSELFDCYSQNLKAFGALSDSQFHQRRTTIESKMLTANLQFFSVVSDWVNSGVERVYNSLRPLRQVGREVKNMLRDAAKERILRMLEGTISRFLAELKVIAARLHVDSYSIGLSVALVQFSVTFKV